MNPHIISVSRREDLPAFRTSWFLEKLEKGEIDMINPFSGMNYKIYLDEVKLAVFWTKNPRPFMKHIKDLPFNYYFQYTLNDYPEYELRVPPLEERIQTFKDLSNDIGKEKVIWRFDPIIVDKRISEEEIFKRIKNIGDQIYLYTNKLVFSYIDPYQKLGNKFYEIDTDTKISIAKQLLEFNKTWGLTLATCAESINLEGIEHNKCIDPDLIERICGPQKWIKDKKDKSQRPDCGCIASADIGTFKTCRHLCLYCYSS
jgi:hypothetical protein